tara:strand:+ start:1404 stop:1535 length:132 start_codon:yes stop_codon:yes gene_type:complete
MDFSIEARLVINPTFQTGYTRNQKAKKLRIIRIKNNNISKQFL